MVRTHLNPFMDGCTNNRGIEESISVNNNRAEVLDKPESEVDSNDEGSRPSEQILRRVPSPDIDFLKQKQLNSTAGVQLDDGVNLAPSSLEDTVEQREPEESFAEGVHFEANQGREVQRLKWLQYELELLVERTGRAAGRVERSDCEAGLGYDRLVAEELEAFARELRSDIERYP